MPWYEKWFDSPYYHQLYFQRDEEEASLFIDGLIHHLAPPADSKMLDVGCGKGRHCIQLASKGFDVTGIDLSPQSIAAAKEHENAHLHFAVHDMRERFQVGHFDYVLNLFTSFGYFETDHEHEKAIKTMAYALKKDGILVIDYLNAQFSEDTLVHKSEITIADVTYYIVKWFDEKYFYKRIVVEDEHNKRPLEYTERVAKFTLGDFNDMLAYQKIQIQEVFGDYNFGRYDVRTSPRMIMIGRKLQ